MPVIPLIPLVIALLAPVPGPVPPGCLLPPVEAPVVDPYREPPCVWCPGNRGLTYGTTPGTLVRAVGSGAVTFSGDVAGTRYVVVEHADGLRATYGGLAATELRTRDRVRAGDVVGRTVDELHFGLRRGVMYVDPTPLLGRLVERSRLVPTDGTPARPAPPARIRSAMPGTG